MCAGKEGGGRHGVLSPARTESPSLASGSLGPELEEEEEEEASHQPRPTPPRPGSSRPWWDDITALTGPPRADPGRFQSAPDRERPEGAFRTAWVVAGSEKPSH